MKNFPQMLNYLTTACVISISLTLCCSRSVERKVDNVGKKAINLMQDTPIDCYRKTLFQDYVSTGKKLQQKDIERMQSCSKYFPECKGYLGTLSATYFINETVGGLMILFELLESERQECLGYYLEIKNDIELKTEYFNVSNTGQFQKIIYVYLGVTYNFRVVSIPDGESLTLTTSAPSECQLQVIGHISRRIQDEDNFFKNCDLPSYSARKGVAEKICKQHPINVAKRWQTTKHRLVQEKCKFVLLPNNVVHKVQPYFGK
ncbi:uncharacterized protein LOC130654839 [Hydractinia symbiolongicarpus]|uniref:uncharacterized protein LOC130654839 n=1 Tax=Hydractinia symbiolongicarpus TaxID=13093 RepID=UPI00254DF087|nr:uncharacterized protein LOC130654839 [Hydractinia symbiolongicarpus]XP_057313460.1 uncharacterized protein LOC130654839 [Hydractinia symbiolongicarpus]